MKIENPQFLCTTFCYANNLRIVYVERLLYHSRKVYQAKCHGHSSQKAFDKSKKRTGYQFIFKVIEWLTVPDEAFRGPEAQFFEGPI